MVKWFKEWWYVLALALLGVAFRFGPAISAYVSGELEGCTACTTLGALLEDVGENLGDAFLIAALLALTVDTYLKRKLVEEVSSFIRGAHLPIELRREIDKIARTDLYRSDFEQTYEITDLGEFVKLKLTTNFFVNNPSNSACEFAHRINLQKTAFRPHLQEGLDRAGLNRAGLNRAGASGVLDEHGRASDYDIVEYRGEKELAPQEVTEFYLKWSRKSYIPPNSVAKARFWNESTQFLQLKDELTFYSLYATVRHRVSVLYPDSFKVTVTIGYHDQEAIQKIPKERPTVWNLPGALLPMSAVTVNWLKPPPEASQPSAPPNTDAGSLKNKMETLVQKAGEKLRSIIGTTADRTPPPGTSDT